MAEVIPHHCTRPRHSNAWRVFFHSKNKTGPLPGIQAVRLHGNAKLVNADAADVEETLVSC